MNEVYEELLFTKHHSTKMSEQLLKSLEGKFKIGNRKHPFTQWVEYFWNFLQQEVMETISAGP